MIFTRCDQCHNTIDGRPVTLSGVSSTRRGILLPDSCRQWHFCNSECLIEWVSYHLEGKFPKNMGETKRRVVT